MVISQGEVWWADLPEPTGSGPGFRRPVVVLQGNSLNRSRIATVICVPLTSNLRWASAPGNVLLPMRLTGLLKDSVANASQIVTLDRTLLTERTGKLNNVLGTDLRPFLDRTLLTERTGKLPKATLALVLSGIDVVLGR